MKNEYSILAHTDDTATVIDANGNAVYFATSYDIALRWVTAKRVGMIIAQQEQQPQEGSDIAELADQFKKAVLFQAVAAQVTRSRYFHRLNEIDLRIAQITLDLHNENDGERAGHLRQEFNALYAEREEILPFG
jgi:hypothetical protein